jgi:hypothetical protein
MNTQHVKQLFMEYVGKILAPGVDKPGAKVTFLVRGNLTLKDASAVKYSDMLDKICKIVTPVGTWSRASVDDLLSESVSQVIASPAADRPRSSALRRNALWLR